MTRENEMTKEQIKSQIKEWQKIQYRASQMRNATQVMKANRELEKLYRKLDSMNNPERGFFFIYNIILHICPTSD